MTRQVAKEQGTDNADTRAPTECHSGNHGTPLRHSAQPNAPPSPAKNMQDQQPNQSKDPTKPNRRECEPRQRGSQPTQWQRPHRRDQPTPTGHPAHRNRAPSTEHHVTITQSNNPTTTATKTNQKRLDKKQRRPEGPSKTQLNSGTRRERNRPRSRPANATRPEQRDPGPRAKQATARSERSASEAKRKPRRDRNPKAEGNHRQR